MKMIVLVVLVALVMIANIPPAEENEQVQIISNLISKFLTTYWNQVKRAVHVYSCD